LAGAGKNPILAPFAIIIGLLIWFNLVSQVYLVSAAWSAIREGDLKSAAASHEKGLWGSRHILPGKIPVDHDGGPGASVRRPGTGRPRQK
jgi:membrane protein